MNELKTKTFEVDLIEVAEKLGLKGRVIEIATRDEASGRNHAYYGKAVLRIEQKIPIE